VSKTSRPQDTLDRQSSNQRDELVDVRQAAHDAPANGFVISLCAVTTAK
jgi:hypothetical protein